MEKKKSIPRKQQAHAPANCCSSVDCTFPCQSGDALFCRVHRDEWRETLKHLRINDIALTMDLISVIMETYCKHGMERSVVAFNRAAYEAGYGSYLDMLVQLSSKRLQQEG